MLIELWNIEPFSDNKVFLDNLVWRILKEQAFNKKLIKLTNEWEIIRFCYRRYGLSGVRTVKRQNRIKERTERRRARRR